MTAQRVADVAAGDDDGREPRPAAERRPGRDAPAIVRLDDERATDAALTGAKAAALARAAVADLPVLPGAVLTTAAVAAADAGDTGVLDRAADDLWEAVAGERGRALVARSSSTMEDLGEGSMAGRFESVVGIADRDALRSAVDVVLGSRQQAAEGTDIPADAPIAVLVQPLLDAECGGVLFGVDPVTRRPDRLVVSVAEGAPERLVSGEVDGTRYVLDRGGAVVEEQPGEGGVALEGRQRRDLVALAERAARTFGGPQDVEWAFGRDGCLWLLQSRPVTTEVAGVPQGPVLGPGPVAETFPDSLSRLEQDLWLPPLRDGICEVLGLTAAAPARRIEDSPVVVAVDGRVAVDLELFGEPQPDRSLRQRLAVGARLRTLRAAWRVGRLRRALPGLAEDLVHGTDRLLAGVPPLDELSDRQLVALLERSRRALTAVHGHEMLVGLLTDAEESRLAGASVALRVLHRARAEGLGDDEIVARHPVVLALVPPRVQAAPALPPSDHPPVHLPPSGGTTPALLREALRLRVRWLQELGARAAWELGVRLAEQGALRAAEDVRHLRLDGLAGLVAGRAVAWQADGGAPEPDPEPLPRRFRLSERGRPVPERVAGGGEGEGAGAGGGVGRGVVHQGDGEPPEGAVLVVPTLDPGIAPLLGRLHGLVAETGSVLAHVAILAREAGVPTAVAVPDACARFPAGTRVRVDGTSGEVVREDEDGPHGDGGRGGGAGVGDGVGDDDGREERS